MLFRARKMRQIDQARYTYYKKVSWIGGTLFLILFFPVHHVLLLVGRFLLPLSLRLIFSTFLEACISSCFYFPASLPGPPEEDGACKGLCDGSQRGFEHREKWCRNG